MEGLLRGARTLGGLAIGAGIAVEFFIYDGENRVVTLPQVVS
jgi:hypothetical protein